MTLPRSRRTFVTSALALVTASAALVACSSSGSGGGTSGTSAAAGGSTQSAGSSKLPKTLVFSPLSLAPPALKSLSVGVQGYGKSQGWDVIVQDPNFDAAKQVQSLNEVIQSGRAGAAWVLAVAPKSMGGLIKTAQSKGTPILINGKPAEYGFTGAQPGVTFDYIDYDAGGGELGKQTANCANSNLGGKGKVLWIQSAQGSAGKQEFDAASKKALLAGSPGSQIVQTLIDTDRTKAQTDVSAALQGHPDINAVMAANDEGALGAMGAFAAAGKDVKCITDFGGNAEVLKDVASGKIYASVALQLQADMKQSFDTLVKMQGDPKATGLVLTVPIKTVTANG